MEHSIEAGERKYLEVHVAGRKQPKRVPLVSSLPIPKVIELGEISAQDEDDPASKVATLRWFYELFREHVGPDIDRLDAEQFGQLVNAWKDASEAESGTTLGE